MKDFDNYDISNEDTRTYIYPTGEYKIYSPVALFVKKNDSDSHRVVDAAGQAHIPARGWLAIRFSAGGLEF